MRGDEQALDADVTAAHRAATLCHLANIAAWVGRALAFEPKEATVGGDAEAAALLRRKCRERRATPKGA